MSALRQLRWLALLEGLSLALLVFVGMPLKHALGLPLAVRVLGSVHGVLFLAFVSALARAALARGWTFGRAARLFGWSLVPGGALVLDRELRTELELATSVARDAVATGEVP